MDRLSGVLISAICFLMCFSAAIVYTTWFREGPGLSASSVAEIEEEMSLTAIAMNTQKQVINGGGKDMWIRVEIQMPDVGAASAGGVSEERCELVSDTIVENPSPQERKRGVWVPEDDGYYYYSIPVHPGEQSRPLFHSVRISAGDLGETAAVKDVEALQNRKNEKDRTKSVRVRAEGIQVNWISGDAGSCQEAYRLFELYRPVWKERAEFV